MSIAFKNIIVLYLSQSKMYYCAL